MLKKLYKKCLTCGKDFHIYPYQLEIKKYCSSKCRLKGEWRNCRFCTKLFYVLPGQIKKGIGLYCSKSCSGKNRNNACYLGKYAQKGYIPPTHFKSTGLTFKGTISEYKHLHYRINTLFGKPNQCEKCGKIYDGRQIDWANKSGKYTLDRNDWIRLCKRCHWHFDGQERRMYA